VTTACHPIEARAYTASSLHRFRLLLVVPGPEVLDV
jgi:hypothetical protein